MKSELPVESGPGSRVEMGTVVEEMRHELPASEPESWGGRMTW